MSLDVSPSSISSALMDRDAFLTGLVETINAASTVSDKAFLKEVRQSAVNWVRHTTLPTTRDEEWRFTDISSLKQHQFTLGKRVELSISEITTLPETDGARLVFVNGLYSSQLSSVGNLSDGVVVTSLENLSDNLSDRLPQYLAQAEGNQEVFTALNTAGLTDAAVIWVSKNVVIENPIHILFINTEAQSPNIYQQRCLVVAESGSQVSLIEEFRNHLNTETKETKVYFSNAVTEIWVEENAQVNHVRVAREGDEAFHVGKTAVTQARYSRYSCNAITFGGKFSRHNLEIFQIGEQTETTLNGLTMIKDNQLADTHSALFLNHPYGNSRQLQKCIIDDKAHAVFNGKVFVPKQAQLTDAGQLNRNLLLSSKARIDTKPQLEIIADNVKCAHGATVSQLEDDEIFYLQSRGIDETAARHLLINAFAAEIINQLPIDSLKQSLTEFVSAQNV
jgi:Fe-S cluster assembly protein SufD